MPATKFRVLDGGTIDLYSANLKTAPSGTIYADGSAVRIAGTGSHVLVGSGHNLLFAGPTHTIGGASATIFNIGVSGDTMNFNVSGVTYNFATITGNPTVTGDLTTNGMLYAAGDLTVSGNDLYFTRGDLSTIHKLGHISFDWSNNGANDNWAYHGIGSVTAAGTLADSIRINSYNHITLTLDSNNNDATSAFTIRHHATDSGAVLFQVDSPTGNASVTGALSVSGDLTTNSVIRATNPVGFYNASAAQGIKIGSLVISDSYTDTAASTNAFIKGALAVNGDISGNSKVAIRTNDAWLRLNADSDFTSGTYTPKGIRADGGLAAAAYTLTAGEVRADIFRAGDSASYYLDPDNTTVSLAIAGPITVGGYQLEFLQSNRDFVNGTLITTDIDYSGTDGDPWYLEIKGNSYGSSIPFDIKAQGYIYGGSMINRGGISNGTNLTGLVALNSGGKLCFWFPRQAYWQGFNVYVNDSLAGRSRNRVVSITDVVKPAGATKEVAITLTQSLHTGNHGSGSHIPSGGSSGQVLKWSSDGVATWGTDNDTVYTHPSVNHIPTGGATGNILQWSSSGTAAWKANGTSGQYLSYDGSWATPPDTNTWRPIDDTPVNGSTTTSISSNWAYDHDADPSAHHSNAAIVASDTRSTNHAPQDRPAGLTVDFRANTTDGLADGGSYHGVMSFRTYSTGSDFSGGPAHQLAFTENGNLFIRKSTSATAWGTWVGLAKLSGADFTGTVSATNKRLVLRDDSIEHHADDNDTAGVAINYYGYNGGTSRFRNFTIYDGKGASIMSVTGSSKNVTFASSVNTGSISSSGAIVSTIAGGTRAFHVQNYVGTAQYCGNWGSTGYWGLGPDTNSNDSVIRIGTQANDGIWTGYAHFKANNLIATGTVTSSGAGGFASATYVSNARNPIWRFGNSDAYGISYYQGTAGNNSNDTIAFHFGTAVTTSAAAAFQFDYNGVMTIRSNVSGTSAGLKLFDPGGGAGEGLWIQWGTGDQGEIIRMGLSTVAAGYGDWYLDMRPNASTATQRNLTVTASGAVKPRYLVLPVGADAYAT